MNPLVLTASPLARGSASARARAWRRVLAVGVVLVAVVLPWMSAGDHALYPPDEGRYAAASRIIADGGSWLVPLQDGKAHLTKPPLTYWLQALCIEWLGPVSLAPRLPSLIAGSATTLMVLALGWRLFGPRVGVLAAALMATMPLIIVTERLATTDALLAACWLAALGAGIVFAEGGRRRWAAVMWTALAAGLLVKGPVALIPLAVLCLWLLLAGRARDILRFRPQIGLPLIFVPILLWATLVLLRHPGAVDVWRHEIVDRAVGSGEHAQPIWYFLPVLLIGCYPATAMLSLPVFNSSWGSAMGFLRSGTPSACLALAILVPLVILSLNSGKLPTYVLPLGPALALVAALAIERWLRSDQPDTTGLSRVPDVRWTLALSLVPASIVAVIACFRLVPESGLLPLAFLLPPAAGCVAVAIWSRGPSRREAALAGIFASWVLAVGAGAEIEDLVRARTDPRDVLASASQRLGSQPGKLVLFGFRDGTLPYYAPAGLEVVTRSEPAESDDGTPCVLLASSDSWSRFDAERPDQSNAFEMLEHYDLWPRRHAVLIRPSRWSGRESLDGSAGSPLE